MPQDPVVAERGRLITKTWRRLNEIRAAIAAELGQQVFPLSDQERWCRVELAARIREVAGDNAEARCDHALVVLEAEAREARSLEWLAGKCFSANAWARLQAKPRPASAAIAPSLGGGSDAAPAARGDLPAKRRRADVDRSDGLVGGIAYFFEIDPRTRAYVSWWLDVPGADLDGPAPGEREWLFAELTPRQWQLQQAAIRAAARDVEAVAS